MLAITHGTLLFAAGFMSRATEAFGPLTASLTLFELKLWSSPEALGLVVVPVAVGAVVV